jgi:hypothetical protein
LLFSVKELLWAYLVNGVGIAQTVLGHTSTDMGMAHYSHLSEKIEHMREVATRAAATSH